LIVAFGLKKYFMARMNPDTNSFRRMDLAA
jgi:hypothetical protein